jgi:dipeptidyl aminopeptidase/acylaminoacyl peptidase
LPKWSPDGQQIAFAGIRIGEPMQIELISAEGGTPREVYPEARNQGSPARSADGQSLIFGRLPWLEIRQKLPVRLVKFDFRTRQLADIPDSVLTRHVTGWQVPIGSARCGELRGDL